MNIPQIFSPPMQVQLLRNLLLDLNSLLIRGESAQTFMAISETIKCLIKSIECQNQVGALPYKPDAKVPEQVNGKDDEHVNGCSPST